MGNQLKTEEDYLEWTENWIEKCGKLLKPDGLFFIFGQLGKREHLWLHLCSLAARILQFHDMLIWDRAVGYNERCDSFTPCYEMILVLHIKRRTRLLRQRWRAAFIR
jgi:site-specific DNA-methyltransferase (adenine-specific)